MGEGNRIRTRAGDDGSLRVAPDPAHGTVVAFKETASQRSGASPDSSRFTPSATIRPRSPLRPHRPQFCTATTSAAANAAPATQTRLGRIFPDIDPEKWHAVVGMEERAIPEVEAASSAITLPFVEENGHFL